MYKISALRKTGNKNQQVALSLTIALVYSFDECKGIGFNINRNQYDYSKISNNNKISTLQPIIKNTKKKDNRRMIRSKHSNDLKDKAVARSTFFKYIPSNFKNAARKTDLCNTYFKQNMEIGTRPDSINLDHYDKQGISVLGFGVLYLKGDKAIGKVYFDYLSEILNHDSAYAGDCLIDLISTELLFKKFTKIDI
ncbi:hypothetical protein K502DRAFT_349508 [Neoconidiobolus thromboides FSU 785]|nr:hypothetical protein K502DRAFT_349508 [Neoconidiobolus thromboides FSU 785]